MEKAHCKYQYPSASPFKILEARRGWALDSNLDAEAKSEANLTASFFSNLGSPTCATEIAAHIQGSTGQRVIGTPEEDENFWNQVAALFQPFRRHPSQGSLPLPANTW